MASADRLSGIVIDDEGMPAMPAEIMQERRMAISDLLEGNRFALPPRKGREPLAGPFRLAIGLRDNRLILDLSTEDGGNAATILLSLTPFRQAIGDYVEIWKAHRDALAKLPQHRIEAIDMARRGIHNEGGRIMMERLEGKAETDLSTARRLFTLLCALRPMQ